MIKPIKKPAKKKPLSYYQKKADRLLQELGRMLYKNCSVCGGEYSCLHHFIKKSQSTALRYDMENMVNICNRCHCGIHQGKNDVITAHIVLSKGQDWLNRLEEKKREGAGGYYSRSWYEEKIEYLEDCLRNSG